MRKFVFIISFIFFFLTTLHAETSDSASVRLGNRAFGLGLGRETHHVSYLSPLLYSGTTFEFWNEERGNYTKDGSLITTKVGSYKPNSNGLFDMAGNVAEWTSTAYTEAGILQMNDMNPELYYNAAVEDPYYMKKKAVRGGSWKDPEKFIESSWRTYEYQNEQRSYIGFRCVRTQVGTAGSSKGRK